MNANGCKTFSRQIDELGLGEEPNAPIRAHLQSCASCRNFYNDRLKLRQMIGDLAAVTAPGDFDFRLRARLAQERNQAVSPFSLAGFGFGLPSIALAILAVVVGVGLYVRTTTTPVTQQAQVETTPKTIGPTVIASGATPELKSATPGNEAITSSPGTNAALDIKESRPNRRVNRTVNNGIRRDQFFARSGEAPFPLEAVEPMRVSVDYATGGSRTISLPAVSFGSQQVVASGASIVKTSARTVW
jgi:hypothetical protein